MTSLQDIFQSNIQRELERLNKGLRKSKRDNEQGLEAELKLEIKKKKLQLELVPKAIHEYIKQRRRLRRNSSNKSLEFQSFKDNRVEWVETRLEELVDDVMDSASKRRLEERVDDMDGKRRRPLEDDADGDMLMRDTHTPTPTADSHEQSTVEGLQSLAAAMAEAEKGRTIDAQCRLEAEKGRLEAEKGRTIESQARLEAEKGRTVDAQARSSLLQALLDCKEGKTQNLVPPSPNSRVVPPSPRRIVKAKRPSLKRMPLSVPRIEEEEPEATVPLQPVVPAPFPLHPAAVPAPVPVQPAAVPALVPMQPACSTQPQPAVQGAATNPLDPQSFALDGWFAGTFEEYQALFWAFEKYLRVADMEDKEKAKLVLRFASFSMCLRENYTKDNCGANTGLIGRPNQETDTFIKTVFLKYADNPFMYEFVRLIVAAMPNNYELSCETLYDGFKTAISQYINVHLIQEAKAGYRMTVNEKIHIADAKILKSEKDQDNMWLFTIEFFNPEKKKSCIKTTVVEKLQLYR